jgi:hypothetical protein
MDVGFLFVVSSCYFLQLCGMGVGFLFLCRYGSWLLALTVQNSDTNSAADGGKDAGGVGGSSVGSGGTGTADTGVGGTVMVVDCPKQAGENPRPSVCAEAGTFCSVREACGICIFESDCDYFSEGPEWDFADPLQNTGRSECPATLPATGTPCTDNFLPDLPECQYCDGVLPTFRACIEGMWVSVVRNYCVGG